LLITTLLRQEQGYLCFSAFYQTRQDFATSTSPLAKGICCAFPVFSVGSHPDLAALQVA
jgi:hypothetical protein